MSHTVCRLLPSAVQITPKRDFSLLRESTVVKHPTSSFSKQGNDCSLFSLLLYLMFMDTLWTCFVFKKKKRCLGGCLASCSDSCFGLQCFSVESAKPYTTRLVLRKENAPSVSGRENSKLQRQSPLLFWNSIHLGDWAK